MSVMRAMILVLSLALAGVAAMADSATPAEPRAQLREWQFDVYLDDKPIGTHEFRVTDTGAAQRVETSAAFDVRFLFFNAFRYRHTNVETWQDGCLQSIESQTDSNGKLSTVTGTRRDGQLHVDTGDGSDTLDGCVMTFAYWDRNLLQAERLLNSQTGLYEPVEVDAHGEELLRIGNTEVEAERYTLAVKGREIHIWYSTDKSTWLALQAPAKGDRVLRYTPSRLPDPVLPDTGTSNET